MCRVVNRLLSICDMIIHLAAFFFLDFLVFLRPTTPDLITEEYSFQNFDKASGWTTVEIFCFFDLSLLPSVSLIRIGYGLLDLESLDFFSTGSSVENCESSVLSVPSTSLCSM